MPDGARAAKERSETKVIDVEQMWRCEGTGRLYVSPRCGAGHEHTKVIVTTTRTVEVVDA